MLHARWHKVASDLWGNRGRTLLVVISMAVGIFAVGMVTGMQALVDRQMAATWDASVPAHAIFYPDAFDSTLVQAVRRIPGVADAQGALVTTVRLQVGPEKYINLQLVAPQDYADVRINRTHPQAGDWPPGNRQIVLEQASLPDSGAAVGDAVTVATPWNTKRSLEVVGVVHAPRFSSPAYSGGYVAGYVTWDTMEWLGFGRYCDELSVTMTDASSAEAVQRVAGVVRGKVEKAGYIVYNTYLPVPGEHPAKSIVDALVVILFILGILALGLSALLIVNTISALLVQQVRQIGILKAIGANFRQIAAMYLCLVLAFGLLALVVALPLSIAVAYALAGWIASLVNFDLAGASLPQEMVLLEVALAVVTPLLAALWPVRGAAGMTVRQAITSYGLSGGAAGGRLDRALRGIRGLPRPALISLRNAFRSKGRLALTLVTLSLAGAMFIAVVIVRDSLETSGDDLMSDYGQDVWVNIGNGARMEQVAPVALAVPQVERVEASYAVGTRRQRPDGAESSSIQILGVDPLTDLTRPNILQGRWLLPDDVNAIVIGSDMARAEPDIRVGDEIQLKLGGRDYPWRVVGIMLTLGNNSTFVAYAPVDEVLHGAAGVWPYLSARIVTTIHDRVTQETVAKTLEARLKAEGFLVNSVETRGSIRARITEQLAPIVMLLMLMAVLLAVVGGIGLAGTMSINVLERTREIGVLRAVGASDGNVRTIVLSEGLIIGAMSWFLGCLAAVPLSLVMANLVGVAFLLAPLHYTFSAAGCLAWLGIALGLSLAACLAPARGACRVSVRQALAYE